MRGCVEEILVQHGKVELCPACPVVSDVVSAQGHHGIANISTTVTAL